MPAPVINANSSGQGRIVVLREKSVNAGIIQIPVKPSGSANLEISDEVLFADLDREIDRLEADGKRIDAKPSGFLGIHTTV